MQVVDYPKLYLGIVVLIMIPVSLSYGAAPTWTIPALLEVPVESVNAHNLYRAIMGLYLAFVAFWVFGYFRENQRLAAIYTVIVFMLGAASGRILSMILDGQPSPILFFYTFSELAIGLTGVFLIYRQVDPYS